MNKYRLVTALIAIIFVSMSLTTPVYSKEIEFTGMTTTLQGVSFVDSDYGWAVGGSGVIYSTNNGGKHWSLQKWEYCGNQFTLLRDVKFVNRHSGWAVGHIGDVEGNWIAVIIHTSDGGKHWGIQAKYPTFADIYGVVFVDRNNGWASGVGKNNGQGSETIFHTANGGITWNYQTVSSHSETIFDIDFADRNNGWGAAGEGNIWHTSDGGLHWQLQNNPLFTNYSGGPMLRGVCSVNKQNVWAAGDRSILHTNNGGTNWNIQYTSPSGSLEKIYFNDIKHGWAVGSSQILHTRNGGSDWETQTSAAEDLKDVKFISKREGWAVGGISVASPADSKVHNGKSTIIHTVNGGQTWEKQFFSKK